MCLVLFLPIVCSHFYSLKYLNHAPAYGMSSVKIDIISLIFLGHIDSCQLYTNVL